ncbi:VCBS repeat protein [Dyadobacter jejuensis]|uniref:VCBS repeat protein n=1 Tax=Dyadobacter jejuensis TaxID=1082580 RepID=A0A316BCX4_9BACT|nr:VCBS repeat-containing protein [Dyadobacter jejuensis]PWJ60317.1 VCBS repeat protein [Dyadobacter jejuensis]
MILKHKLLLLFLISLFFGQQLLSAQDRGGSNAGWEVSFNKEVLTSRFISEGAAVGDVNRDGQLDVLSGAYWFEGPHWTPHQLAKPDTFKVVGGYSDSFLNFAQDVNGDGWVDLIRIDWPGKAAYWHENPKNTKGHWPTHLIHTSVGNESPIFVDMDEDGRLDLLCNDPTAKEVIWLKAPSVPGVNEWTKYVISSSPDRATHMYTHGLGYGDVDGDGRKDVLVKSGWWKGPENIEQEAWEFVPANLGEDCSQMYVLDLNDDGLNDVISASAHRYGIWWHEQGRDNGGAATWTSHLIDSSFSQTHGMALADMNGDGRLDLVTGKRYFAHSGKDPGGLEPALMCWYEKAAGTSWVRHVIDQDSGVGLHVTIADLNKDGRLDLVTGNKKGVRVFLQNP